MRILETLRKDLVTAMRERRKTEASTIRTLIAAVENAGAVEAELSAEPKLGFDHDVPRRDLSDSDVQAILDRERTEVVEAIAHYQELGLTEPIGELEIRLGVVERYHGPSRDT